MNLKRWTGPPVDTHTYLLCDEESRAAWVMDAPLQTASYALGKVHKVGLRLERLILTHGHFDHVLDAGEYQHAGIPVAYHPAEQVILDYPQTREFGVPFPMPVIQDGERLEEGTELQLGPAKFVVWHTPGHAPGHVVLYSQKLQLLVGGDLLFQGGFGRVDLPGSDPAQMRESLRRLLSLPNATRVLPGHGPETTIGQERAWLQRLVDTDGAIG